MVMQLTEGTDFAARLGRFTANVLAAAFLSCALLYALSTLFAIVNFGWRQPMSDQYKEYGKYLSQSFPESVFMLENGHRPIIPALIANIEILWFHANQMLQLTIGTLCAFLTFALIAWTAWRQADLPRAARAAGVMLAALGLLWLGNARMLLQGMGQLQTYMVALFVTAAALCTYRAAEQDSWGWIAGASVACAAAMFTFGSGVAALPTIIVLGVLLRVRWQKLSVPMLAAVICFGLYLLVLPGHDGVQNSLSLRPLTTIRLAAEWLSSPWANGWLALANPPLQPWLPDSFDTDLGRLLVSTANWLVVEIGSPWRSMTTALGTVGIAVFLARLTCVHLRGKPITRSEALANALCMFACCSAILVGIGRLDYLEASPEQIYAERYLIWPCLFWMGLAWLVVTDVCRLRNRFMAGAGLIFLVALPIVLYPTHAAWAGWGASTYRTSSQSAASVRSGVFDDKLFPSGPDASRKDVLHALALLKGRHLAMFAEPSWEIVGSVWGGPLASDPGYVSELRLADSFLDSESGLLSARIEGVFRPGSAPVPSGEQLTILDDDNRIVGLAEFSSTGYDEQALHLGVPPKRGFDGYIRGYRADRNYRLVLMRTSGASAIVLKQLDSKS